MLKRCDVLIVGCGAAGLYTALCLPENFNITVLSKNKDTLSNSSLAQGGVASVLSFENDSFDLHIEDTMIAGQHANDIDAVTVLVHEGPDQVRKIMEYGVDFDKNADGTLQKTLEGGHSRRRIVHHKDTTGAEIVDKLLKKVREKSNITLVENAPVFKLSRVKSGICAHALTDGGYDEYLASYCVLATGGIGRVYKYTTNPSVATGDGIRLAYELGARIKNLSYVQFHPTAFNSDGREQFLISEAVRGEGAYLLNCNKERFMHRYDERLELAPRDVVSKAIIIESRRTGSNNFYLDITHRDREYLLNRFPGIYEGCLKYNVDITKDLIPIFPCQHYLMGGIEVDLNSRTTVSRLYAVGECSNTGVHGKNRLASNSLLEALVFAKRCADDIERCIELGYPKVRDTYIPPVELDGAPLMKGVRTEIRGIMQRSHFVMPANDDAVRTGYKRVSELLRRLKNGRFKITTDYCEALSLATVAYIILKEVSEK
ncbi:MAG: FAD-binding protein [Oscillospiraceae bacterium]|nr:FAD-binding protein [Oscillospiraceae bacterium]